jgi:hypothetical protein
MYGSSLGTHAPRAGKNVDERIKGRMIPRQLQPRARRNGPMDQRDGRVRRPRAAVATDLAAITRTNAPASADTASFTAAASMPW